MTIHLVERRYTQNTNGTTLIGPEIVRGAHETFEAAVAELVDTTMHRPTPQDVVVVLDNDTTLITECDLSSDLSVCKFRTVYDRPNKTLTRSMDFGSGLQTLFEIRAREGVPMPFAIEYRSICDQGGGPAIKTTPSRYMWFAEFDDACNRLEAMAWEKYTDGMVLVQSDGPNFMFSRTDSDGDKMVVTHSRGFYDVETTTPRGVVLIEENRVVRADGKPVDE